MTDVELCQKKLKYKKTISCKSIFFPYKCYNSYYEKNCMPSFT